MKVFKTNNYTSIVAFFVSVFALLIFSAAFYPTGWNWGFHLLAFYRLEIIIIIPLLMLLIIIPAIQEFFLSKISLYTQWLSQQHRIHRIVITSASLGGLIIAFWIFRVRLYFLGDGQLILRSLHNFNSADVLALAYNREPLIEFCIVFISNIFVFLKRPNPLGDAYIWLSILSGICFVILAWRFVRYYIADRIEQYLLFILLITTGVSQLFFGYVENYPLSSAGILLFLHLGVAYLRGTISVAWVMVAYGVSFTLHFGTLIFLPAFAFLLYSAVKKKQTGELAASLFLTGALVFTLLQISLYPLELFKDVLGGTGRHIVPFSFPLNKYQAYLFFSISHLLDVFNYLFLSCPAAIILLILSSIMIWRKRKTITIESKFLFIAGLCGITFIIILNCELGMSRDWDILAPISLGIPIAAIALWNTIEYERMQKYRILLMLCIVSLLHTSLWVGVNADETRAEERFKILPDNHLWSKHAHLDAYEELAIYHRDRGDYEEAIQYYEKYITLDSTNQRLWRKLADAFQLAGHNKKAIEVYETMLHLGMSHYQIITNLGVLLNNEQRFSEALVLFKRAEVLAPEDPIAKYNIGLTIIKSEQAYKKAIPYFLYAIQLDSTFSEAYNKASQCYFMLGDSTKAYQMIIQLLKLKKIR
jgi:Tfp pilus assembly protein PilF